MQISLYLNQQAAREWGISAVQAMLFAGIYEAAVWADREGDMWYLSREKLVDEVWFLRRLEWDTLRRHRKVLVELDLINYRKASGRDLYSITEKGLLWRRSEQVRDAVPVGTVPQANAVRPSTRGASPISNDWQPSADAVVMVRQANPGVSNDLLSVLVARFRLYWLNRGDAALSWDSKFIQRAPYELEAIRREQAVADPGRRSTRDASLAERLTDRSWAYGSDGVSNVVEWPSAQVIDQ